MMPPSACQPWPTDTPARSAGERNDAVGSYTTPWDTIRLCHCGDAGELRPDLKCLGPGTSILFGWKVVAAEMKEVVDPSMGGEKTLRLPSRLAAFHLPFSSSCRLM